MERLVSIVLYKQVGWEGDLIYPRSGYVTSVPESSCRTSNSDKLRKEDMSRKAVE